MNRTRKALALLGVSALVGVGIQLSTAGPASAHTTGFAGVAACQADGTYTITWSGHTDQVPSNDLGRVKVTAFSGGGEISGQSNATPPILIKDRLAPNADYQFTQTDVPGSTVLVGASVHLHWTGGDTFDADASNTLQLGGDCKPPLTTVDVPAAPEPLPPTCDAPGQLVVPTNSGPYKWLAGPDADQVSVHLIYGYQFSDGSTHKTFTEDLLPQKSGAECAGDQPPNDVEHQDITDAPNCTDLTVTTEHQSRTREYVLDGSSWVPGPWSAWTTDSTTVTDANGQQCDFFIETSYTADCGTATITLHNHSPWVYPVSYREDGSDIPTPDGTGPYGPVVNNLGANPNDQTASKTFTYPEDSGVHTITFAVRAGTENQLYVGKPVGEITTITVQSNCQPDQVVPEAPSVTAGVCDKTTGVDSAYTVNLPADTDAITYSNDDLVVTATLTGDGYVWGTLPDGWTVQDDGTTQYTLTVTQPDCSKEIVTPPPSTSTTPPPPPSTSVTPPPPSKVITPPTKRLATTGSDTKQVGIIGGLVLGMGILLTLAGRRRQRGH